MSIVLMCTGAAVTVAGVALLSIPVALILSGIAFCGLGVLLFDFDTDGEQR